MAIHKFWKVDSEGGLDTAKGAQLHEISCTTDNVFHNMVPSNENAGEAKYTPIRDVLTKIISYFTSQAVGHIIVTENQDAFPANVPGNVVFWINNSDND